MKNLLIIGGSDAGISSALRAKELDPSVTVTMILADRFPNFSICGLPFYISGEVQDWRTLAHRTISDIEEKGIRLLLDHKAESIDPAGKTVHISANDGNQLDLAYDSLLVGTGAVSAKPPVAGTDLPGVFFLRWMQDGFALQDYLSKRKVENAVVIGGGYIGMEMADALTRRGIRTTVIEFADTVLTTVDADLGNLVAGELERNNVSVVTKTAVREISQQKDKLNMKCTQGMEVQADLVIVAAGSKPNTDLLRSAGAEIGAYGAVKVDRMMRTSLPGVFSAGDCVETWHRVLGKSVYLPLGTTAHKQGRIAGENMVGGKAEFQGSLGTQAVKIFDLVAARTGLRDSEAHEGGFQPVTKQFGTWDHKVYYPDAHMLVIRITGDKDTGKFLGAQIIGHKSSEVSKRIDIFAAALYHGMKVSELEHMDLSYTPPLSSPWDPIQMAAQAWHIREDISN
jgi:NADPH-dependent 2,4-dienoyl-CoA reductase/sulfur reductase-like enzyme